jgi:hypothetical protein
VQELHEKADRVRPKNGTAKPPGTSSFGRIGTWTGASGMMIGGRVRAGHRRTHGHTVSPQRTFFYFPDPTLDSIGKWAFSIVISTRCTKFPVRHGTGKLKVSTMDHIPPKKLL